MVAPVVQDILKKEGIYLKNPKLCLWICPVSIYVTIHHKAIKRYGETARKVVYDSGKFAWMYTIRKIKEELKVEEKDYLELVKKLLTGCGFGKVSTKRKGESLYVIFENPSYASDYVKIFGVSGESVCAYLEGILAGIFTGLSDKNFECEEEICYAQTKTPCTFKVLPLEKSLKEFEILIEKLEDLPEIDYQIKMDLFGEAFVKVNIRYKKGKVRLFTKDAIIASIIDSTYFLKKLLDKKDITEIISDSMELSVAFLMPIFFSKLGKILELKKWEKVILYFWTKTGIGKNEREDIGDKNAHIFFFKNYVPCLVFYTLFGKMNLSFCEILIKSLLDLGYSAYNLKFYSVSCKCKGDAVCSFVGLPKDFSEKKVDDYVKRIRKFIIKKYS